eukprot:COSAG01_NODE_4139_length_5306_cov_4.761283_4_plen_105_part_00
MLLHLASCCVLSVARAVLALGGTAACDTLALGFHMGGHEGPPKSTLTMILIRQYLTHVSALPPAAYDIHSHMYSSATHLMSCSSLVVPRAGCQFVRCFLASWEK